MVEIKMKRKYGIVYRIIGSNEKLKDEGFFCHDEEDVRIKAHFHYAKKGIDIEILEVYEIKF